MSERRTILSRSEDETLEIGKRVGGACIGGELISLVGPLGSGKSVLARGMARGVGVEGPVRSPSFNLMREYRGRLIFRHWDLYRLEGGFRELGLVESVEDDALVVVEWAERWPELDRYCTGIIYMSHGERENERSLIVTGDIPGAGL